MYGVMPSTSANLPSKNAWKGKKHASEPANNKFKHPLKRRARRPIWKCCNPQKIVRFLVRDWLFLVLLGITVACLSLAMDSCIDRLQRFRLTLINYVTEANEEGFWQGVQMFIVWMSYTTFLVVAAAVFSHYVAPQAFGSGIPELKTILRGVMLKEYLSLRTLISKMVGLTLAIGSGLPVGKEGPFAHTGSIVANLLSRLAKNFEPLYANESRNIELLAAGCAVGVACTFSSPVGGVLFSIEVTSEYFAVRDYWRGFFAASCSSALFALLRLYLHSSEVTVSAYYQTTFRHQSFLPEELFVFAFIGFFCGIVGALFIFLHRRYVLFLRRNSFMKAIFQRHWFVYPICASVLHAVIKYPKFIGQFLSGQTVFSHTLKDFFKNCTWSADPTSSYGCSQSLLSRWTGEEGTTSIFFELIFFIISFYFLTMVTSTLPIPAGIFMPVFVLGGAMGRLFGETMSALFPTGFRGNSQMLIYPGIYAVVGAASFCGAVTHTVSVAVIAFEMTGQLLHIVPVMIGVIIASVTCSTFQPSFFESLIKVKRLPYLPDIPKATSAIHQILVKQIMVRNVKFISKKSTYAELEELLLETPDLHAFPLVDSSESRILLGSVNRESLLNLLDAQIGDDARRLEAVRRAHLKAKKDIERAAKEAAKKRKTDSSTSEDEQEKQKRQSSTETTSDDAVTDSQQKWILPPRTKKYKSKQIVTNETTKKVRYTLGGVVRNLKHGIHRNMKKHRNVCDLSRRERAAWEEERLNAVVDFTMTVIDSAPFQLVESTSLHKVHSLFSLLGVRRAYVTKCGVLVGVVSLKELRLSIELSQSADLDAILRKANNLAESACEDPRSLAQSIIDNMDDDSDDTDDEDIILPRVEVDKGKIRMPDTSGRDKGALSTTATTVDYYETDIETVASIAGQPRNSNQQLVDTLTPYLNADHNDRDTTSGYHITIQNGKM